MVNLQNTRLRRVDYTSDRTLFLVVLGVNNKVVDEAEVHVLVVDVDVVVAVPVASCTAVEKREGR